MAEIETFNPSRSDVTSGDIFLYRSFSENWLLVLVERVMPSIIYSSYDPYIMSWITHGLTLTDDVYNAVAAEGRFWYVGNLLQGTNCSTSGWPEFIDQLIEKSGEAG